MRWLARLAFWVAPLLILAACAHDPIRYIPETDRTMLQAQGRLGTGGDAGGGPISVDEMLRRAKSADANKEGPTRIVLRFEGDSVQPNAGQRETLRKFATQIGTDTVVVSSRPGGFGDPGAPILGPRRAVAVSHELSDVVRNVQVRFEPSLPPDVVIVSLGSPTGTPTGNRRVSP